LSALHALLAQKEKMKKKEADSEAPGADEAADAQQQLVDQGARCAVSCAAIFVSVAAT
jgi:hypothetical protein